MTLSNDIELPFLPTTTIVPTLQDEGYFLQYFMRLYEDLAFAINFRDFIYFTAPISSTATNIPNVANFGSFIVCVSGETSTLPTITASLCKADMTASGSVAVLGSQAGTDDWAGNTLTITSTATNFQIAHNNTGVMGNFNIKIIGTQ
jgi:hypothetical protein